jgi:succinate-acetate transporter protein
MDKTANPAPLGLFGFGMTTILLNLHNAGFFPVNSAILGMGIFFGGIAQVIAGIMEFRLGNTFGFTAFTAYGFFWLTLVALWLLPLTGLSLAQRPDELAMGWYLAVWGIFTLALTIGTLRANRALQYVFVSLTVLFFLLAVRDWTGSALIGKIAGYEGLFCGASAVYLAAAEIINAQLGRDILPIGKPAKA